jgi:hypothetical protein
MSNHESTFRTELSIIPGWAKVLAVACAGSIVVLVLWAMGREPKAPPFGLQVFFAVFAAVITAVLVLLIGFVNRDAGRRGMSRVAWTLIVIFVPNALGFILYFLLRKPLLLTCPRCAATVLPDFNFCPKCDYKLAPTCPSCSRAVQPGDLFCAHCGADLRSSQPART